MKNSVNSGIVAGGAALAVGGVALIYAVRTIRLALQSRTWPRVIGKVLKTGVIEIPTARKFSKKYRPVIVYSYAVDDVPYRSEQIGFGFNDFMGDGMFGNHSDAEAFVTPYRPGADISIAYDPQDHFRAVIKTGLNKGHVATLIFGLFFVVFGAWCLWNFRR
ncbi:MAG: hypothetical protein JWM68_4824 [Verrucomicrobiales bacterium]|nr:hypothetical protein [Verrucomicrobiales bacterium]